MAPHVRTVKTSSGATAVQIVYSNRRGSRDIEHIGSAHTPADVELLKAVARDRLAAGQGVLDLHMAAPAGSSDVVALPAGATGGHLSPAVDGRSVAGVHARMAAGS